MSCLRTRTNTQSRRGVVALAVSILLLVIPIATLRAQKSWGSSWPRRRGTRAPSRQHPANPIISILELPMAGCTNRSTMAQIGAGWCN